MLRHGYLILGPYRVTPRARYLVAGTLSACMPLHGVQPLTTTVSLRGFRTDTLEHGTTIEAVDE